LLPILTSSYVNSHVFVNVFYNLSLVEGHVIYKEGSGATSKPKQPVMPAQHHYEASSPALCNHNISLLDAGQLSHQICSKTFENDPSTSMLHSKYFPHQYKPTGDYPSKLTAADTHHVQQLTRSWKAGNAAQVAKTHVYIKNQPLTPCTIEFNLR